MACSHVAHDCVLGDRIILANNVLLAGHVIVEDGAILNGAAAIQQFTTIGRIAYVGGLTRIVQDVPPFMVVEGNPAKVWKANIVGLQRNGYSEDQIAALREAHRVIFRSKQPAGEDPRRDLVERADDAGGRRAGRVPRAGWSAGRSAARATADEGSAPSRRRGRRSRPPRQDPRPRPLRDPGRPPRRRRRSRSGGRPRGRRRPAAARRSPDLAASRRAIKAAVVATPTLAHHAVASALLDRGVACLVEKPLAATRRGGARPRRRARGARGSR